MTSRTFTPIAVPKKEEEVRSPLHSAVLDGQLEEVEALLKSGVSRKECYGESAFHYASKIGDIRIIELLSRNGFEIDKKDNYYSGNSPLHLSCRHSCLDAVEFFLSKNANVCAQNNFGETPFHFACETGNLKIINLLINHHKMVGRGAEIDVCNLDGLTPLMFACMDSQLQSGALPVILDELQSKAPFDVDPVDLLDYSGKYCLYLTIMCNSRLTKYIL